MTNEQEIIPHEYQTNYRAAIRKGWNEGFRKQVVVSPTGSGKTCMFSWESADAVADGKRVLILVDQNELVWQTIKKLKQVAGIVGEPEKAEFSASDDAKVVVATVQSMARRLDGWSPNHFGLVVADEADKSIADQWKSTLNHFDEHAKVLGFTATPSRTDKRSLGEYYENLIELENLKTLIQKGYLSPLKIEMLPIKLDFSGKSGGRDFTDEQADAIITPHLEEIARQVTVHGINRRTLVFLPLIKTCENFNRIAQRIGLNAEYIYGDDPDRDGKLERFKAGKIAVLANSMLLARGVDIPEADCLFPCRVTKSVTLYFQMVGRITRITADISKCKSDAERREAIRKSSKPNAVLIDPLYQCMSKLVCRPARLIAKDDEEAEQITKLTEEQAAGMPADVAADIDLLEVAKTADSQREAALRKKLEEHKDKKAKTISAEEFAIRHNNLDLAEFQPTMKWHDKPLTPKQSEWVEKAGVDIESVHGRGQASALLSVYFANLGREPATNGQKWMMRKAHWVSPDGRRDAGSATRDDAKQFFASQNKAKKPEPELSM